MGSDEAFLFDGERGGVMSHCYECGRPVKNRNEHVDGFGNGMFCESIAREEATRPAPVSAPADGERQEETFDEWFVRTRDDGGEKIEPRHGNAETCGYLCRAWGHEDACLRAAWDAARRTR